MRVVHWIIVALGALGAASTAAAPFLPPTWQQAAHGIGAACIGAVTSLGLTTDKIAKAAGP